MGQNWGWTRTDRTISGLKQTGPMVSILLNQDFWFGKKSRKCTSTSQKHYNLCIILHWNMVHSAFDSNKSSEEKENQFIKSSRRHQIMEKNSHAHSHIFLQHSRRNCDKTTLNWQKTTTICLLTDLKGRQFFFRESSKYIPSFFFLLVFQQVVAENW